MGKAQCWMSAHIITDKEPTKELLLKLRSSLDGFRKELREKNIEQTKEDLRSIETADQHIIQAINTLEDTDKVANTIVKRMRDWYKLYWPELEKEQQGHKAFLHAVLEQKERPTKSMGGSYEERDMNIMIQHAMMCNLIYDHRDMLLKYLDDTMKEHTPNLQAVAGTTIGAKLLAMAGSLKRLSRMPSGTIQLLGAETALFRHLRSGAKPPKHGVIYNHQLMQRTPRKNKGRLARALADNIALASRVDYFKGDFTGDELYKRVEDKS